MRKQKIIYYSLLYLTLSLLLISCVGSSNDLPSLYKVTLNKSILTPVPNGVGVTVDDSGIIWIMSGLYNGVTHYLTGLDINTAAIVSGYSYDNLLEYIPGTGVYGIAWDGTSIWISVSGNLNKLVKVNPNTGSIISELSSPTTLGPSDLSWDGANLWISSGTGQIYKLKAMDNSISQFLEISPERDSGIAIRKSGEVWIGDLFNKDISIYNPSTAKKISTIRNVFKNTGSRSLAFYNDQLVVLTGAGLDFYDITPN